MAAASYIRAHTSATDRIAILAYDTPVLYLSGRGNATRFGYALPLVGWRSSQAVRDRYRREFLDALVEPPAYIVVGLLPLRKEGTLASFPEFVSYLSRGYVLEQSFGEIDLYHPVRQIGVVRSPPAKPALVRIPKGRRLEPNRPGESPEEPAAARVRAVPLACR
jgi:hypothetical protein